MPRIETGQYASIRSQWVTVPQAAVRFYHVTSAELLINTEQHRNMIANLESIANSTDAGIRSGTGLGSYDFAQSFVPANGLSEQATLDVDIYVKRIGVPAGHIFCGIHESVNQVTPAQPANSATLDFNYRLRLGDGREIDTAGGLSLINDLTPPQPISVGSVIVEYGVSYIINEGTFVSPNFTDPGDYLHGPIPEDTRRFPAAAPMPNGLQNRIVDAFSSTGFEWITFGWTRQAKPALVPQTTYWLVFSVDYPVSSLNHIKISGIIPGGYGRGSAAINTQASPTSWEVQEPTVGGDLLFRVSELVTNVSGVIPSQVEFSRDFSSGTIMSPLKPYLVCIGDVGGNTQTVDPAGATSSQGNLTLTLVDVDGDIMRHCGAIPGRLSGGLAAVQESGNFISFNEPAGWVGRYLPSMGTLEVAGGERIRYDSPNYITNSVRCVARGVDGTTPTAVPANTLAANGEVIRQGQRVTLGLGYQGLPEDQWMPYGTWEVTGRQAEGKTVRLVLSDMQRYLRKTVFLDASIDRPYEGEIHPVNLALHFLLSTGTGVNGPYDAFTADQSLGLPQQFVNVESFTALLADYPNETFYFSLTGPMDGKQFLEEQIFKALGVYPYIDQNGRYSVKKYRTAPPTGSVTASLTEDDIGDFVGMYDAQPINELVLEFDYNLPELPEAFATRAVVRMTDSRKTFGRRAPWTLRSYGLRTSHGAEAILKRLINDLGKRYSTTAAPPMVRLLGVPYRRHTLDIGDIVKLTHSQIPALVGGVRGLVDAVCEVQNITPTFLAKPGGLTVELLYVGGIPTLTGGWEGLSFPLPPEPPPPPSGLELVVNGVGQGNGTLFWGKDIHVRWNTVAPIIGLEPMGTEPNASGLKIEGYWGEVYAFQGDGSTVLRRSGLTQSPNGEYLYEQNAADNGGTAVRFILIRIWTQGVGGIRSSFPAELAVHNDPPDMSGFTPQIIPGAGVALINWGAWPQSDLDLDKYQILYASSADPDWVPGMDPNKFGAIVAHPGVTYTDVVPFSGVTYRVRIIPFDVFGPGQLSEIVEWTVPVGAGVDTTPPAPPTGVSAATGIFPTADGRQATFGWVSWNRNTEPDIAYYILVYRQLGTTPWTWEVAYHYPVTGPTMTVSAEATLPATAIFEIQVAAVDLSNNQSAFAPATPIQLTIASLTPPAAPAGLTGTTGTTIVDGRKVTWAEITWTRITTAGIASYVFRYRQLGTTVWTELPASQPTSGATVGGRIEAELPQTMTFELQVCSVDFQGLRSAFAPATPVQLTIAGGAAPAVPTGLTLTTGAESTVAQDGSYLAWVEATWTRNTESDMLRYNVQGRLTGATNWDSMGSVPQTTSGNPILRVQQLPPGIAGDVRVQAEDRDGHQSAFCTPVAITAATFATASSAPATPTVAAGPLRLNVAWTPVAIPDLVYYEIHEGTTAGFTVTGTGAIGSGTCIGHSGAAQFSRSFPVGTPYPITRHYRIIAVRVSGTRSAPSTSASGTADGVETSDVVDANVTTIKLATGAVSQLLSATASVTPSLTPGSFTTLVTLVGTVSGGVVQVMGFGGGSLDGTTTGSGTGIEVVRLRIRNTTTGTVSRDAAFSFPNGTLNVGLTLTPMYQTIPVAGTYTFVLEATKDTGGKVDSRGLAGTLNLQEFRR